MGLTLCVDFTVDPREARGESIRERPEAGRVRNQDACSNLHERQFHNAWGDFNRQKVISEHLRPQDGSAIRKTVGGKSLRTNKLKLN